MCAALPFTFLVVILEANVVTDRLPPIARSGVKV